MYYADHEPPHFHAKYGEFRATLSIADLKILQGDLPKKVIALILEWAFEHRDELMQNWKWAQARKPLGKIEPLV